jgi:three-Cys-motif partner protein
MLNALLHHRSLPGLETVQFTFLFIEIDARRCEYLREQINAITIPKNVEVQVENGAFEEVFVKLVESIKGSDRTPIPTFAFIDPFGYSQASMSLTGRFLNFPRSEALFFLPLSFVHRFVGRQGQEGAMNNLFDSERWREAIPLDGAERSNFLLGLFEVQLQRQGQVKYVRTFSLHTKDGNEYCLVFATGHVRGLNLMKTAMWTVDPIQGTSYTARTESGQQVLFVPEPDTGPLLEELRNSFGSKWFSVPQACEAMIATPYVPEKHLKKRTLVPAEKSGALLVRRPDGKRAGVFTDDVRMRFK